MGEPNRAECVELNALQNVVVRNERLGSIQKQVKLKKGDQIRFEKESTICFPKTTNVDRNVDPYKFSCFLFRIKPRKRGMPWSHLKVIRESDIPKDFSNKIEFNVETETTSVNPNPD